MLIPFLPPAQLKICREIRGADVYLEGRRDALSQPAGGALVTWPHLPTLYHAGLSHEGPWASQPASPGLSLSLKNVQA